MRFIHTLQTENFILMVRDVKERNNEGTFFRAKSILRFPFKLLSSRQAMNDGNGS